MAYLVLEIKETQQKNKGEHWTKESQANGDKNFSPSVDKDEVFVSSRINWEAEFFVFFNHEV